MELIFQITTTGGKTAKVSEEELLKVVYEYVNERYQEERRQIILNANGENRFVIVPFNPKM